jgi:hypothetical protein
MSLQEEKELRVLSLPHEDALRRQLPAKQEALPQILDFQHTREKYLCEK